MSGVFQSTFWWQYTSPNSLPNLQVWYNASAGDVFNKTTSITNGTSVTSWQNAGGLTSHDWNSTGGRRPVWYSNQQNKLGVVRFLASGTQYLTINPVAYLQSLAGVTFALLYKTSNIGAGTRIVSTTDTNGFRWGQNGTQWIGGFAGATFTVDSTLYPADTNYHHVVYKFDGSKTGNTNRLRVKLDSIDITSALTFSGTVGTTTSPTASSFYGGVDSNGSSNYWDGDIGELLIWTSALTDGQIASIENYLTTKWNV